jgi:hypothetical protein
MKMMVTTTMMTMTLRGWRLASTGSCKAYHRPTLLRRVRRLRKGHKAGIVMGAKRRRRLAIRAPTRLVPPPKVGQFFRHDLLKHLARAIGSRPQ